MDSTMLEKVLLKFAEENFSDKYYASLHGETKRIRPLSLTVKRHRSLFKRPFDKNELIILEGLERCIESEGEKEFCKALNEMITEEWLVLEPKVSQGASSRQFGVDISGATEVTVKLHEDLGNLELGKLSQKYITDPDIRSLLGKMALDVKKMEPHNKDKLHLITSVIYSEKFELTGGRNQKTGKETPVTVSSRSVPGPILFKCCRVDFNKETKRLEIPQGEYIGKNIFSYT